MRFFLDTEGYYTMKRHAQFLAIIIGSVPAAGAAAESSAVNLDPKVLSGFMEENCISCHGPDKQKGQAAAPSNSFRWHGAPAR